MERVKDKEHFSLGAHGAYLFAKPLIEKGARVIVVTNPEMAKDLKQTYVEAVTTFNEALEIAERHTGKKSGITILKKARRLIITDSNQSIICGAGLCALQRIRSAHGSCLVSTFESDVH